MNLIDLIEPIPDGKKRNHLGNLYIDGLINYYDIFTEDEIDLNELVERDFKELSQKKDFINDLKLFSKENLESIFKELELTYQDSNTKILIALNDYFQLPMEKEIEENQMEIEEVTNGEITLHDFQERIRRKVVHNIFQGKKRFLIHMPTGSGKTRTAAEIILDFVRLSSSKALLNENIKVLWVAQSSELCYQAYQTVKWILDNKCTSNIHLAHFYDKYDFNIDDLDKPMIIFCGIQKLLLHYKKDYWAQIRNDNYLVVVDEAHRSVANQWVNALNSFVSNSSVYLIGLTATPGLGNNSEESNYMLSTYYHSNKIMLMDNLYKELEAPINYLVERNFLAEIERIDLESEVQIPDGIQSFKNQEFKFATDTLKKLSINPNRNRSIINVIKENFLKGKKILVFTCGLEHNRILKSLLRINGIPSETIDQGTKGRNKIIDDFKHGELQILLNFGVLTTGFDAPKTDVCIIARPIGSIVMYSQMVGRILRGPKNNGNKNNKLYTIKDNLGHGDYDALFNSFNSFYK